MAEKKEKKLTLKEESFCEHYVNDLERMSNGTQSAIAAGYSEKTACQIASENLRKPYIRARIQELYDEKTDIKAELRERVVSEYKKLAFEENTDKVSNTDKIKALDKLGLYSNMLEEDKDKGNVTIIINE